MTAEELTNCGEITLASKVQRFFALAGSWMSRTTTVGSPTTVPMTRLSPAGTAVAQCTRDAGPGEELALGDAPDEGVAVAMALAVADGVCAAVGPEPPQEARRNTENRAAPLARTA